MTEHRNSRTAYMALAGAVLFWGLSFIATKIALGSFSPAVVVWIRMILASIVLLLTWKRIPKPEYRKGDFWRLLLISVQMPCLYYLLEANALTFTTSSQAGMISALVPLLVGFGAWLILKEPMKRRTAAALFLSIAGVIVLTLAGEADESAPRPLLGNVMELGAMICAAGSMLLIKTLSKRYSPWFITAIQSFAGFVFFLPGALLHLGEIRLNTSPTAWIALVYLGIFVSVGAFGLYNTALARLPAAQASMAINMVPLVSLLAGRFVLNEALAPWQWVGCAMIALGVFGGLFERGGNAEDRGGTPLGQKN